MVVTAIPSLQDWRQGSVLPESVARDLGLITGDADMRCAVVVSHDCDIVNSVHEADLEVIVGTIVSEANGSLTGGKNSRKLHLSWIYRAKAQQVELCATDKRRLPKSALNAVLPDAGYSLEPQNLVTLRYWLAARYNRAAFPDEFNARLQKKTAVFDDITGILKPLGTLITAVYVQLDTQEELPTEPPTPPYRLTLFLAFEPGYEPLESANKADAVAARIADVFGKRCFDKETERWNLLELRDCVAISEDDMTVSQAKKLQQLPLEYISLRTRPQGVTPLGAKYL